MNTRRSILRGLVRGYAIVWDVPDGHNTVFGKDTDLGDEPRAGTMLLWRHGGAPVGKVVKAERDERGLHVEAQLDTQHPAFGDITASILGGGVGWSTGAMPHLVQPPEAMDGNQRRPPVRVQQWPIGEYTLTPQPSQALTTMQAVRGGVVTSPVVAIEVDEPSLAERIGEGILRLRKL